MKNTGQTPVKSRATLCGRNTNYGGSTYLVGVANGTIFVTLESLDASMPFMPVVIYGDNFQAENR